MGENVDWDEPDPEGVDRLVKAWLAMGRDDRPRYINKLLAVLEEVRQRPYPDFIRDNPDIAARIYDIDRAVDQIVGGLRTLGEKVPKSNGWHVLRYLMEDRLPKGIEGLPLRELIYHLPDLAGSIALTPPLQTRPGKKGAGAPVKRPYLRQIVRAVCWYIVNEEGKKLKFGFDDDSVTNSRDARLVKATLAAKDIEFDDTALQTELVKAKGLQLAGMNFDELIPITPTSIPARN